LISFSKEKSMRSLPPLNALRAFEATARNMSVTKAANELNVTPSAVSHQIKALEEYFDVKLFLPSRRKLRLTDSGRLLIPALSEAFNKIFMVSDHLRSLEKHKLLTVGTARSFAVKWLIPKISEFTDEFPDIEVRIAATPLLKDATEEALNNEDVDIVVRFGPGHYSGYNVDYLFPEVVFPVCSPYLIKPERPLNKPSDLRHFNLIHDEGYMHYSSEGVRFHTTFPDWAMWLEAVGVTNIDANRGSRFSTSIMAIEAALDGQGIVLGRSVLVQDDLATGRLIKPLELSISNLFAYYAICLKDNAIKPEISVFRYWLERKAKESASIFATNPPPN